MPGAARREKEEQRERSPQRATLFLGHKFRPDGAATRAPRATAARHGALVSASPRGPFAGVGIGSEVLMPPASSGPPHQEIAMLLRRREPRNQKWERGRRQEQSTTWHPE